MQTDSKIQPTSTDIVGVGNNNNNNIVFAILREISSVGVKDLWLKDKDKDFPQGQQHWVTVIGWLTC